jgi:rhodanese-related sulfurtransferase
MHDKDLIDTMELKEKLDGGDSVTPVMTLGEWEYRTTHIPGSMRVSTVQEALEELDPEDEIVLYDSGPSCPASRMAFRILKDHGYERVRRGAGGVGNRRLSARRRRRRVTASCGRIDPPYLALSAIGPWHIGCRPMMARRA